MTEKTKKIIDRVFSITWWTVFLALFALIFGIISAKMKGEVPKVFGYSVVKIISPSMGEEIPVGSYVLIKETAPEDIEKWDIICFYSDDPAIKGYPNLHRVVQDPIQVGDGYEYVTKGDGNIGEDPVNARSEKLIGKYVDKLDWLEDLSNAVSSKGMILFVGLMGFLSVGMIVAIVFIKSKEEVQQAPETNQEDQAK